MVSLREEVRELLHEIEKRNRCSKPRPLRALSRTPTRERPPKKWGQNLIYFKNKIGDIGENILVLHFFFSIFKKFQRIE